MTIADAAAGSYRWADAHAGAVFLAAVLIPLVGALLAQLGKGGRTDADGKLIASVVLVVGLAGVLLEILAILGAGWAGADLTQANLLLVLAPPVGLLAALLAVRWVFPLQELAGYRAMRDVGAFVLAVAVVLWLFSRFHWGVIFWGNLGTLLLLAVAGWLFLRRLFRRAFGRG